MIAIVNIGPQTDDPGGERNYEVRINRDAIVTFIHARREGLSVCLRKAAEAVEAYDQLSAEIDSNVYRNLMGKL